MPPLPPLSFTGGTAMGGTAGGPWNQGPWTVNVAGGGLAFQGATPLLLAALAVGAAWLLLRR